MWHYWHLFSPLSYGLCMNIPFLLPLCTFVWCWEQSQCGRLVVSQSYFREHVWSVSPVVHHYGDFDGDGGGKSRAVDPYHVSHCARSSCLAGVGFLLSASVQNCVIIFSLWTCIFSRHLLCWIMQFCIFVSDTIRRLHFYLSLLVIIFSLMSLCLCHITQKWI